MGPETTIEPAGRGCDRGRNQFCPCDVIGIAYYPQKVGFGGSNPLRGTKLNDTDGFGRIWRIGIRKPARLGAGAEMQRESVLRGKSPNGLGGNL